MISQLRIISYNCRGWRGSSPYVSDLLSSCDILLIQEHWLFRENFNVLNISDQFIYTAISGMDSSNLLVVGCLLSAALLCIASLYLLVSSPFSLTLNVFARSD